MKFYDPRPPQGTFSCSFLDLMLVLPQNKGTIQVVKFLFEYLFASFRHYINAGQFGNYLHMLFVSFFPGSDGKSLLYLI